MQINRKQYQLPGESSVEVFKVFPKNESAEVYFAIVESRGRYPEVGQIAQNYNRDEYIVVLDGEIKVTVNDNEPKLLKKDQDLLIKNGDKYFIDGVGRALVLVRDLERGESRIVREKE